MGASGSVSNKIRLKNNTYISYADEDKIGEILHNELWNSGINVLQATYDDEYISNSQAETTKTDIFREKVKGIMTQSHYVIICISEKTTSSFYQAIEITTALDHNVPVMYIMTDQKFTPLNTPCLNGFVRNHKWLPAFDKSTLIQTMDEVLKILSVPD
jgi:hypothetical protein